MEKGKYFVKLRRKMYDTRYIYNNNNNNFCYNWNNLYTEFAR